MTIDLRFRKRERLRRRGDFARVYAAGRAASDQLLVIYVLENGLNWSRLGLSVGKRVGGAVRRNRIRRRLREAFRKNKADFPIGLDMICVVKPGADSTVTEWAESLRVLVAKAARRRAPSALASKPESALQKEDKPSAPDPPPRARPPKRIRRD